MEARRQVMVVPLVQIKVIVFGLEWRQRKWKEVNSSVYNLNVELTGLLM